MEYSRIHFLNFYSIASFIQTLLSIQDVWELSVVLGNFANSISLLFIDFFLINAFTILLLANLSLFLKLSYILEITDTGVIINLYLLVNSINFCK